MAKQLLKSGMIVSFMTLLSRILGVIRDIVMANYLGASWISDVYFIAQKIPNFLRRLFAEGAFSQAFVPVLSEYQTNKEIQEVKKLIADTAGTLSVILFFVVIIGVVGSPVLVTLFGPGFVGKTEQFELASLLLKITFPYILFISITGLCGSVLNSIGRFAVPAFTPVLLNICIISAAILYSSAAPNKLAMALAWGIFFAGIIQLLFQLPFLWKEGLLLKPKWGWGSPGVQKILALMLPTMFGVSVAQINLLLDTVLASLLQEGSVTWLFYSARMLEFPLGIFAIAISTVILPTLSKQHVGQDSQSFNRTLNWGLRLVCMIGIPATIGLVMMAEPIILTVFQRGEFTVESANFTAQGLRAYIVGLLGFMLIKVLATGFFSRQDTKTPVKVGVIAMAVNMVFNLLLFFPLAHVGLALATAISATVNASLLFIMLRKKSEFRLDSGWLSWLLKLAFANLVLIVFIHYLMPSLEIWREWGTWQRLQQMAILVFGSIAIYAISLTVSGVRMKHLKASSA